MQYHAKPCYTMRYHAISCNTMQYHAIQCNTMQYHAIPLDFKLQHFPVRQLAGSDRSETMPDRIQLKQIAPTVNTTIMNENLGWVPNLDSFFYFVQKFLEVLPAAHFIMDWRQIRQGRSFPGMISRNKTS